MEKKFKVLMAVLCTDAHNMKVLHWKSEGKSFDTQHNIAADLADKICESVDYIAEVLVRTGSNPLSYKEVLTELESDSEDHLIAEATKNYEYDEFVSEISTMLKDILKCIENVLEDEGLAKKYGIKSTLEAMHDEYDHELNYLNARRKD